MATIGFTYDYPYTYYNEERGRFTWQWSESRVTLNRCYTYPVQFNSSLPKCSHINLDLEIENTGSGTVLDRSWDFYVYRDSYGWYEAMTFTLPSDGKYTIDCDLNDYNISKLAFVPSSNPGSSRTWTTGCSINQIRITETLEINELASGTFQYGVFTNRSGVKKDLTEVYANIGGTLTQATNIFANANGTLVSLAPVYSAYLRTESEIMYLYKFIPPSDGTYKIKVKRQSGDHEIRFYDGEFTQLYDGYFYDRSFSLTEGSVYYITLTHYYANTDVGESYLQIYKEGV
ncbi:MAG: hypothetical protein K5768_09150 [Firmicutes bacterium]|nr:hypothetical protein [Bacillota bacterium]